MKRMHGFAGLLPVLFAALLAVGCSAKKEQGPSPVTNAPAGKSTVDTFLEGATGKTALDAGRTTQDKIRKIGAEHNKDLEEVKE